MRSVHLIAKGHARARSPKTLVTSHIYLFDGHLMETSQRPERPSRRLDPPRTESRGSLSLPVENYWLSRRKLNESSKVPAASLSRPGDLVFRARQPSTSQRSTEPAQFFARELPSAASGAGKLNEIRWLAHLPGICRAASPGPARPAARRPRIVISPPGKRSGGLSKRQRNQLLSGRIVFPPR